MTDTEWERLVHDVWTRAKIGDSGFLLDTFEMPADYHTNDIFTFAHWRHAIEAHLESLQSHPDPAPDEA